MSAGTAADVNAIADEVFALLGTGRQVTPFCQRRTSFGLPEAYRCVAGLRALREARGERVAGRKIGFTNRTIWSEYEVYAPIWNYVYDTTLFQLDDVAEGFPLDGLPEPRIEPEIAFGFVTPPRPDMDERDLLSTIGWVAHGFEIVQSIFPGWKFSAADTVAGFGLHGALILGPHHKITGREEEWLETLSSFEVDLLCDGQPVDTGHASNVLDGPLSALRHLVAVLADDPVNPPLAAGEVVTTGTVTRALPVRGGQTWSTRLRGLAVDGIEIRLTTGSS